MTELVNKGLGGLSDVDFVGAEKVSKIYTLLGLHYIKYPAFLIVTSNFNYRFIFWLSAWQKPVTLDFVTRAIEISRRQSPIGLSIITKPMVNQLADKIPRVRAYQASWSRA